VVVKIEVNVYSKRPPGIPKNTKQQSRSSRKGAIFFLLLFLGLKGLLEEGMACLPLGYLLHAFFFTYCFANFVTKGQII